MLYTRSAIDSGPLYTGNVWLLLLYTGVVSRLGKSRATGSVSTMAIIGSKGGVVRSRCCNFFLRMRGRGQDFFEGLI